MNNVLVLSVLIALVGGSLVAWIWVEFTTINDDCSSRNAIQNLRYTEIDFRKIEVNWDPPSKSDSSVEYVVTVSSPHTPSETYQLSRTTLILENMEPCLTYNLIVDIKSKNKYKGASISIKISDIVPEEPEFIVYDWVTKTLEWSAKYKHCIWGFQLKVNHSGLVIKDIILSESARKYELLDLSTCSWYNISIQTLGKKSMKSPQVVKRITPAFPISKIKNFIKNLHYDVVNSDTITLRWNPSDVDDQCVKEFFISVPDAGIYFSLPANETKVTISPLKQCMEYSISIVPFSIHKDIVGKIAEISVKTSKLENEVENVTLTESRNALNVKWWTPIATYPCAEFCTLDICALDLDTDCQSFKPNLQMSNFSMGVSIPDVIACTVYKVLLSVMKSNKLYEFHSEIYESKVKVHEAPVLKQLLDIKPTSASIQWGLQDSKSNRCPVHSIILDCTTDGNSFMSYEFVISRAAEQFQTDIEMLTPYSNYSCYSTFNQHIFKSEKSSVVTFITPEDVPSAVQNVTVVKPRSNGFLLMWQTPKSPNGVLKSYQVLVKHSRVLYPIPAWCSRETRVSIKSTVSAKEFSYNATRLESYEEYIVSVSAATNVGFGASKEMIVTTLPSTPRAVTRAQYFVISPHTYMILWKQPCNCNGILKLFKVTVKGVRDDYPDDTFSYSVLPNISFPDTEYSLKLPKLRAVYNYNIQISARVEGVEEFGEISTLNILTPPSVPSPPHYDQLEAKVQPEAMYGRNGTQVKISLKRDMFEDTGGDILYYALIVGQDISLNQKMESDSLNVFKEWPPMSNFEEASKFDFLFPYQVTPPYWNPFQGLSSNESVDFVIGEDVVCEIPSQGFCNGPLKPNTKYCLKIRGFTAAGYQDSPPLKFTTGSEIGGIIHANYLSVVCVILFLTFLVCGLYYARTRHIPVLIEVTQRMNNKRRLAVVPTKSIPVKKFAEFYLKLQESPHILKIEFNELNEISLKYSLPDNVAKRYDNYRKNRFTNFLPYDETRVKINTDHGDYINASFIEGYKETRARYIACQGPLAETFSDFWAMILQYDIKFIVMLCQVVEKQKLACEKYFPDVNQVLTFNGIRVECTIMTSNSLFEERKIIVSNEVKEAAVCHIKFLEWPDFGTPSDPEILVDFCNAVRKRWTDTPIVVHCSAGVGRTGTFIACDILLQQLSKNKYINIFNTVLQLRKQRPGMVQSVAQYLYLYECAYNAIKRLRHHKTEISTS